MVGSYDALARPAAPRVHAAGACRLVPVPWVRDGCVAARHAPIGAASHGGSRRTPLAARPRRRGHTFFVRESARGDAREKPTPSSTRPWNHRSRLAGRLCAGARAAQRRAAVPTRSEADHLVGVAKVRLALVIFAFKLGHIDQYFFRGRAAGQGRNGLSRVIFFYYGTGHGFTSQIRVAYSVIVRSLENFPEPATFKIALRPQVSGSP